MKALGQANFFGWATWLFSISLHALQVPVPAPPSAAPLPGAPLVTPASSPPPETNSTSPARSTAAETVARAGKDLRHVDEGVRAAAAKLLGKYPSPATAVHLVSALDDRSVRVRRAAAVSLSELYLNGFYVYEKPLVEKMLSKLGDPDVEVRREISALMPRFSSMLFRSTFEIVTINGRQVARATAATLRPDLAAIAQKAFFDEDAIVRQNVLKYYFVLRLQLTPSILERLLSDSDLGVLLTALDRVSSVIPSDLVVKRIDKLSRHPDVGVRKKIVAVARDSNSRHPGYRPILRKMTGDEEPSVMAMAAVELARLNEKIAPETIRAVGDYLLRVPGASTQVMTILYGISAFGSAALPVYEDLTGHPASRIRTVAWQRFLTLGSGWSKPAQWLPAVEDQDKSVRGAVLANLNARSRTYDLATMKPLVASKFTDVRSFAAQSLPYVQEEAFEEVGFDLLIDEDLAVRANTIRAYAARRPAGWLKVLDRSLRDDEFQIRRAAMDGLFTDPQNGVPILRAFLQKNSSADVAPLIRAEFSRRGLPL